MWEADVLSVDDHDERRVWVRAPRAFPHGLDELVGAPVIVAGAARSIADVLEPEDGRIFGKGDRIGLVLDPLAD